MSRPTTSPRAAPRIWPAAALALWRFAEQRQNGAAQVRVYNPDPAADGWSSPHTIVEIVNDDMPFLVDFGDRGDQRERPRGPAASSTRSSQWRAIRPAELVGLDPPRGGRPRILDADRDQPRAGRGRARRARRAPRRGPRRRARRGRRLAGDAPRIAVDRQRGHRQAAAAAAARDRRERRFPALARRRQFHLSRLSRIRVPRRGRTGARAARHPAPIRAIRCSAGCATSPPCRPRCRISSAAASC